MKQIKRAFIWAQDIIVFAAIFVAGVVCAAVIPNMRMFNWFDTGDWVIVFVTTLLLLWLKGEPAPSAVMFSVVSTFALFLVISVFRAII